MRILIIDTSKPTMWVALVQKGEVIAEREWLGDKTLGVTLLEVVEELVKDEWPDRIAAQRGPGHFMALRTGVVTAQLLAAAWEAELVEIAGDARADLIQQALEKMPVAAVTPVY